MIPVSEAFLAEVNGDNRNFLYYIDATLADTTVLHLGNEDLWQGGITVEDAISEETSLAVGSAIINQCTIILNNINERLNEYEFKDAKIVLRIGLMVDGAIEQFQKGIDTVNEIMYDGSLITLICLDNMVCFDKPYTPGVTYPTSLSVIVNDACRQCNVAFVQPSSEMPMWQSVIPDIAFEQSLTFRDIIAWAAQMNGANARINRFGELEFMWYDLASLNADASVINPAVDEVYLEEDSNDPTLVSVVETENNNGILLESPVFNYLKSLYTINVARMDTVITGVKVIVQNDNADESALNEYVSGTNEYMVVIQNNKFINNNNAQDVADAIAAKVVGMTYRKANYTHIGYPTMEAGDIAFVFDNKNRLYRTLVSSTIFVSGDQQSTYSAGETPVENLTNRYTESTKNYVRSKDVFKKSFNSLQERINNSAGLYTTEVPDGEGGTIYYLHDKPQLSSSMNIWKMTAEAWGVSTDGGETYKYGMTVDGDAIIRILDATGINADWLKVGTIQSRNDRALFNLDRGYFSIESADNLTRMLFRGWAAAIILQHRTSTDQNWDYSKEMGVSTEDTYVVGEIYMSASGKSVSSMQQYRIGTYDDNKVFAYVNDGITWGNLDRLGLANYFKIQDPNANESAFYVFQNSTDHIVPIVLVYGQSLYGSWEGITLASGFTPSAGAENVAHYNKVNGEATLNFFVQGTIPAATETVIGTLTHSIPRGTVTGACCVAVNGNPQFARVTVNTNGEISIWSPVAAAAPHGSISYRILDVTGV